MTYSRRTVLWRSVVDGSLDRCVFSANESGWTIEGSLHMLIDLEPIDVTYFVFCNQRWETRAASAQWREGLKVRQIDIRADRGTWQIGAEELTQVVGALDIDLGITPATNTLAIRRLGLEIGQSASVTAAWVRFPELTVEPLPQRYTRLDEDTYRYESHNGIFTAELQVDDLGIITRYEGGWDRVLVTDG